MLRRLIPAAMAAMLVGAVCPSGVAWADDPTAAEVAKAREEFRRGLALEAANDWAGALAAFKTVALVKSTPQVRYHIENIADGAARVAPNGARRRGLSGNASSIHCARAVVDVGTSEGPQSTGLLG